MMIEVLKSKLHCVTVTEANLHYMGSITIDEDLMDAAGLIAGEKVQIVNNNNGEDVQVYTLDGQLVYNNKGEKNLRIRLAQHGAYIVKVGSKSVKLVF